MKLFVCGDVMLGRGIDQIMPDRCDPVLYEPHMRSALGYVALAEEVSGSIPRSVGSDYVWGDALPALDRRHPDFRIINLETSVTCDGSPEAKMINYRMHPRNLQSLKAARIDCCVLANNHVGDWGASGVMDTLHALDAAGIASTGAGKNESDAARPTILRRPGGGRLLVFAYAHGSSGVPRSWGAAPDRPGVSLLHDLDQASAARLCETAETWVEQDDLVVASIHWGANWGYPIPLDHQRFAHALVDTGRFHVVHGHSSHHPIGIEVYKGHPILYGCGDFINDYEGIGGDEAFRPELVLGYVLDMDDGTRRLTGLEMLPFRLARFRLHSAGDEEITWLHETLDRECRSFGHSVQRSKYDTLELVSAGS